MIRIEKNGVAWCLVDIELVSLLNFDPCVAGRRHYWTSSYSNGKAFVKLFNEKGIIGALRNRLRPRGQLEYTLSSRIEALSIPTPRPLGYGRGRMCSLSIQEWVGGEDFLTAFRGPSDRLSLLRSLSSLLRSLNEGGVCHNDLHTRNILVSRGDLFVIDLHKSRFKSRMDRADELKNMCHALFSIYPEMTEEEKQALFGSYGGKDIRPAAERELNRMRIDWVERKKKRAFKSTSLLSSEGSVVRLRRAAIGMTAGKPLEIVKQDKKARIERFSDHIRKTYRNRRRLKRAWKNHVALEYMDIDVVPIPYCVKKTRWRENGFVAMEDLGARGEELGRFLDRNYSEMTGREIVRFVRRLSSFLAFLSLRGITHRDVKTTNVFVLRDGTFRLLDVEDILFESPIGPERLTSILVQLNKSTPLKVSTGYRLRFLSSVAKGLCLSKVERKALLKKVRERSLADVITYIGASGPVSEEWNLRDASR